MCVCVRCTIRTGAAQAAQRRDSLQVCTRFSAFLWTEICVCVCVCVCVFALPLLCLTLQPPDPFPVDVGACIDDPHVCLCMYVCHVAVKVIVDVVIDFSLHLFL